MVTTSVHRCAYVPTVGGWCGIRRTEGSSHVAFHYEVLREHEPNGVGALLNPSSTVVSQLALSLGGSRLPGVLGSMLVEVLPFLRAAALEIQRKLGGDHPSVLPTTMAAYALTSLLLGAVFAVLGLLRCGRLVAYFPQSVLIGVIGGDLPVSLIC